MSQIDNLILHLLNKKKIIESQYIEKFIHLNDLSLKIITLNYTKEKNINKQILESYKSEPDIIIINLNPNPNSNPNILKLNSIPKYPIFLSDIFYITPICIQQVNGFTNDNTDINFIKIDFVERIFRVIGGILSDEKFNYVPIQYINLNSGIKELEYQKSILSNWFVCSIPKFMTKYIPINKAGWFSKFNKLAIDWVFENYIINSSVELGCYYGKSVKYTMSKKPQNTIYCFDEFRNISLTDYVVKKLHPIDTNYFFKYIKLECFHANLSEYPNTYSIKYNCYNSIQLLYSNKISVDMIYIDFCKRDNLLIKFVDKIFKLYPNVIIIGDDAVHLSYSLKYFKKKYNYVYLKSCYICTYRKKLLGVSELLKKYNTEHDKMSCVNIEVIKNFEPDYKINYIITQIRKKIDFSKLTELFKIFKIDPNDNSESIEQNGNIYHFIGIQYVEDKNYYNHIYKKLNEIYPDKNLKNYLNLTPLDYFEYGNPNFS